MVDLNSKRGPDPNSPRRRRDNPEPQPELPAWDSIQSASELADRVAHDLIQPLGDIVNNVWLCRELMSTMSGAAEIRALLERVEADAMRLAELMRYARELVRQWNGQPDTASS